VVRSGWPFNSTSERSRDSILDPKGYDLTTLLNADAYYA
jgi:hypothetical protein